MIIGFALLKFSTSSISMVQRLASPHVLGFRCTESASRGANRVVHQGPPAAGASRLPHPRDGPFGLTS